MQHSGQQENNCCCHKRSRVESETGRLVDCFVQHFQGLILWPPADVPKTKGVVVSHQRDHTGFLSVCATLEYHPWNVVMVLPPPNDTWNGVLRSTPFLFFVSQRLLLHSGMMYRYFPNGRPYSDPQYTKALTEIGFGDATYETLRDGRGVIERVKLHHKVTFQSLPVVGDGNCQFRALAWWIHRDMERHRDVRKRIVGFLAAHALEMPWKERLLNEYCDCEEVQSNNNASPDDVLQQIIRALWTDSVWGNEVTILAAASVYNMVIVVHTYSNQQLYYEPENGIRVDSGLAILRHVNISSSHQQGNHYEVLQLIR